MPQFRPLLFSCLAGGLALAAGTHAMSADPAGIWTIQDENASISSNRVTDRYYTNGLRLSYATPEAVLPGWLEAPLRAGLGEGARRWTFDVSHQLYTPLETKAPAPPRGDHPYAAIVLATVGLTSDTATHRSAVSFGAGMIGPSARGQEVQNDFHRLIGQRTNAGWASQIRDEAVLQLTASRVYRVALGSLGPFATDALPAVTVGLGTMRDSVEAGLTLRLGQGLDGDFGVARLRPGLSGGDGFRAVRELGWYVFAGLDGQAVAHDITLDGGVFRDGPRVKRTPLVAEGQAGFGVIVGAARVSYTHVVQSQQFSNQKGGLHQFGSFAVSMRF
jgi:hypothetical protein